MIVLLHLRTSGTISRSDFITHSFLFVDFFFVLSGFVITASYGERLVQGFSIGKFIGLRLGRVYPLHVAVLAIFVLFELVFASGVLKSTDRQPFQYPYDLRSLAASLLLVQTFVGIDRIVWNGPSWSIAVEMWTYLLFAAVLGRAKKLLIPVTLSLAALAVAYLWARPTGRYLDAFHDGALARCIYGFALGVTAFWVHRTWFRERDIARSWATVLEAMTVLLAIVLVTLAGDTPLSMAAPPVFVLLILVFAQERGAVSALLTRPLPRLLGTLSFSIYMIHAFLEDRVINLLTVVERLSHHRLSLVAHDEAGAHVGGSALFGDTMSIGVLLLTIGCARLSYALVELPAQNWSRRLILGDHPKGSTAAAEREAPTF